jgi:Ras GTPase-activating-like protein IQGAP2/3
LSNKKAGSFDTLSAAGSRGKLGNHLPRIASGDGEDSWSSGQTEKKLEEVSSYPVERTRLRDRRFAKAIQETKLTPSGVLTNNGVAGLPGRISLKAPIQDSARSSSSPFLGASWADKQRHLLQAYEYLCHVGEAQQWIEGCLEEELECGVVELEDALQNGVILARLVRVFQGEAVVRKIFEVGAIGVLLFDNQLKYLLGRKQAFRFSPLGKHQLFL